MIVYWNGQFLASEEVHVSPDDRGLAFGDGVYEVIRAYQGRLFRLEDHLRRLGRSLAELRLTEPDLAALPGVAARLLQANGLEGGDAAIYVQVTRGAAPRRHAFPPPGTPPSLYITASALQPAADKWENGVAVILVPDIRWIRCDVKSLNLLPSVLASQRAAEAGAEEAIFVRDGFVTEGAHTNLCAVFDGSLVTHPATNLILDGVTRRVVLDLCRELSIPSRQEPIPAGQLAAAAELLISGTTTEIKPVVRVDGRPVGDGRPGPITRRLQAAFRALVAAG